MTRRVACPIVTTLLFLLLPQAARSCTCMGSIPICETFWKTPVVFAGEVIDITSIKRAGEPESLADRRVRFNVERVWRGNVSGTIDVMTSGSGASCGYSFRRGERYLVFAHNRAGTVWTSICTPTKRLADAKEDLDYINQPFSPAAGGRIYGDVTYADERGVRRPAPNHAMILRNDTRQWRTTTDKQGHYGFTGIPAGVYRLDLLPPVEREWGPQQVELADSRGCATASFGIKSGRQLLLHERTLTGQIVLPDGRPVAGASVFLQESSGRPLGTAVVTDVEGRFEFTVRDGVTYRLGAFFNPPGLEHAQWSVRSVDIAVQGDLEPIRLVLEPPRR